MNRMSRPSHKLLVTALLALALLYGLWFRDDADLIASLLVFALPPLLFAALIWRGVARAPFFAGVFALGWFSHGVLIASIRPDDWLPALLEIALSVIVVLAASVPGLRARFAKKRGA